MSILINCNVRIMHDPLFLPEVKGQLNDNNSNNNNYNDNKYCNNSNST